MSESINDLKIYADAYVCPFCGIYAQQIWHILSNLEPGNLPTWHSRGVHIALGSCVQCMHCTLWHNKELVYPELLPVDEPHPSLSVDIQRDYYEAAIILSRSPRGAAALLRVCLIKLLQSQPGCNGESIETDIKTLVSSGMAEHLEQSMDIIRVTCDAAVHVNELDIKDDRERVAELFWVLNTLAEELLPKFGYDEKKQRLQQLQDLLPERRKQFIENRKRGMINGPKPNASKKVN